MFKEVGVEAKVQFLEWATVFTQFRSASFNHQMFTLGWVTSNADADYSLYALFHSKQVPPTGWNTSHYANPKVDGLVEQARRSMNQGEREKLYGETQDILAKEMVWIPVYNTKEIVVTRASVKGFTVHPVEYNLWLGKTWLDKYSRRPRDGLRAPAVLTFIARRLLLAVPVLLGVVFVVMLTVELIPGDAVSLMLGEHATPEAVARLRDYLGLDKPLLLRYVGYVGRVVRGDLGRSIQQNRPVVDELADAWPATLELTCAALVISALAGVAAGVVSAVWPNSLFDGVARVGSLFGLSMPVFWTGLVLIVVFALWLPWLPVGGMGSLPHLVLPAVTLALPSLAMVARMTRSSVLEVLREDYVRTARAKGVAERLVVAKHALRNAAIPILTLLGLQAGQLMGGAVLTETVFSWPGLGRLMVKAIFARDYVLLQGAVLVFALAFVLINLAVDLAYGVLDPRIAHHG